ncbi:hypothetical protein [Pseudonocardia sp. GCM10023141]|uniref:hypothetical protein n=1 Tax=Pseudonocardia sp. GCM10023141 TaxID=3252653 RepID=UPI00360C1DEC
MREIGYYLYENVPLQTKYQWMAQSPGSAAVDPTRAMLGATGNAYSASDGNVRETLQALGINWQGSAADAAGQALHQAADRSGAVGAASSTGSGSVAGYGHSFDAARAKVHWEDPGTWDWWDQVVDVGGFGLQVITGRQNSIMSDFAATAERNRTLDAEATRALYEHESESRAALAAFPVVDPAAALTTEPAGGGGGAGSAHGVPAGPAANPAAFTPTAQIAPAQAPSAPAAGALPPVPIPAGSPPAGAPTTNPSSTGTGAPTRTPVPDARIRPLPNVPSQVTAPQAGASRVDPGLTPPTRSGADRVPPTPLADRATAPVPGRRDPIAVAPPPVAARPGAVSPFGSRTGSGTSSRGGSTGGGTGGGTEFGERMAPRAAEPTTTIATAAGRATGAASAGRAGSGVPFMGGMGAGAGSGATERKARYVIPSADAFEVPLPLHPTGVIEADGDE